MRLVVARAPARPPAGTDAKERHGLPGQAQGQGEDAVDQHGDKIADGIDKAAAMADKKTKGKYTDKIDQGTGKAKEALDKLDGKNDGDLGGPGTGRPAERGSP